MFQQRISVKIELNSRQYRATDSQILRFTIFNNSNERLNILKWNTPLEGFNNDMFIVRRQEDQEETAYLGRMVKRVSPNPEEYVTLDPNGSISTDFDLTEVYDIARSGNYAVEFVSNILDVGTEEPNTLVRRLSETGGFKVQTISSNIVEFNLLEDRNHKQLNGVALGWNERRRGAAELVAPTFKECTNNETQILQNALREAEQMATEAQTLLGCAPLTERPNATRYREWFGNNDQQRYNILSGNFDKIADALANKEITFNCDCDENHYAHVFPTRPYEIFLCNLFWTAPLIGTDSQAGTIIHELSHFNVVAGTDDNAYGQVACRQLAIDNPIDATDNADSHEYFAENTPRLNMPNCEGETQVWFMNGHRLVERGTVLAEDGNPIFVGLPWSIVGVGDMNGNGKADIVWHNGQTNETQVWFMNGHRLVERGTVLAEDGNPIFVGLPWSIVGVGDMNGNGKADIVWHNGQTNETQVWFMNGHRLVERGTVLAEDGNPIFVGLPWSIVGVGDMNGNGKADIVWHNGQTNETQVWFMNGHRLVERGTVLAEDGNPIFVGLPWSIVGVGDMNGNGKADIVWHNGQTNETQVWFMNGHRLVERGTVLAEDGNPIFVGLPWSIVGVGDMNGNGKADIVWHNG